MMPGKKRTLLACIAAVAVFFWGAALVAQIGRNVSEPPPYRGPSAEDLRRKILKGWISGVKPIVSLVQVMDGRIVPAFEESRPINTKIELEFRKIGIKVDENGPALFVVSCVFTHKRGVVIRSVNATMSEDGYFSRNDGIETFHATTWDSCRAIDVVDKVDWDSCRDAVLEIVDQFCNDYLAVNSSVKP